MRHLLASFLLMLALAAGPAVAQEEDDRGFLTRTIENALSGAGRDVRIEGFQGALSAEATFDRMTISDDEGVWLTLEGVRLLWSRASLLRGRLQVQELSAQRLDVPRLPQTEPAPALPDAEAEPFTMPQLPELPVSINVERFLVEQIALGEPVMGVAATLGLTAAARLDDDGLLLDLEAVRTDGTRGRFNVDLGYGRADRQIALDFAVDEAPGGLVARLANLPGAPSVLLTVAGTGPLDDFTADIDLATDDTPRLQGEVQLLAVPNGADAAPDRRVLADLGGDITALFAPQYADFFGPDVGLTLDVTQAASGAIDVSDLQISARAAQLAGQVRLNEEFWPEFIDLTGRIGSEDGARVIPPGAAPGTSLESADLRVDFDAAAGDALTGRVAATGVEVEGAAIGTATLEIDGTLSGAPGAEGAFGGNLIFVASGLVMDDPALAQALGENLSGQARIDYSEGAPLTIDQLTLAGTDYGLTGDLVIAELAQGFPTDLVLSVDARDLSRFAGLAGQDLSGAASLSVQGSVTPLSGIFDLDVIGTTNDLAAGIPEADNLLAGRTQLAFVAARDTTGTFLRDLVLQNAALDIAANAELRSSGGTVTAQGRLDDLARVLPDHPGPVTFDVDASDDGAGWRVDAALNAPYNSALTVAGVATGPEMDVTIDLSVPDVAPLVPDLSGPLTVAGRVFQENGQYAVDVNGSGPLDASFDAQGVATGPQADLEILLAVPDLQPLVPDLQGGIEIAGRLQQAETGYRVDVSGSGPFASSFAVDGLATGPDTSLDFEVSVPDVQPVVPQLEGELALAGNVAMNDAGQYAVDVSARGPLQAMLDARGVATGPDADIAFDLSVPDVSSLAPQVTGPLNVAGTVRQAGTGYDVDVSGGGPLDAQFSARGLATGPDANLAFDLSMPDVSPLAPQVTGPFNVAGTLRQAASGYAIDVAGGGPLSAEFSAAGLATGPETDLSFDLAVPSLQPLVPQLTGALDVDGRVWLTDAGYNVDVSGGGPIGAEFSASGLATGPDAALQVAARLPNVAPFVPQISGAARLDATAARQADGWRIDSRLGGPAGTSAQVAGLVADDGRLDLGVTGGASLALANGFIAPRSVTGDASFDLRVQGAPGLDALRGTIRTGNARFTDPTQRLAISDLATTINLSGGAATLDASGNVEGGGSISAGGRVGLTGNLPADLEIALRQVVLADPRLYTTTIDGDIGIDGPLAGAAQISGTVNVGPTEVSVPASSLTSVGAIPDIRHVSTPTDARRTLRRAGLEREPEQTQPNPSGGFGLAIDVNAPGRIFIRGRGLEAELGGNLSLRGTTNRVISSGQFDLVRGRLDILGKRFDLVEGSAQFVGGLTPFIRFVTTGNTPNGTASIIVEGPADEPEVTFESSPEGPEDEVIAQLLFNRSVSELTAFQALQLANAVAVLAGGSGVGVVGKLRQGLGLDDFDVTTTDSGAAALRAGKYITENIYTEFTAAGNNESDVSINLELTDSLKARGSVSGDGNSGLGFFFERDY